MQPEREDSTLSDTRLARLMAVMAELVGDRIDDSALTIGELGYESSIMGVHRQLSDMRA